MSLSHKYAWKNKRQDAKKDFSVGAALWYKKRGWHELPPGGATVDYRFRVSKKKLASQNANFRSISRSSSFTGRNWWHKKFLVWAEFFFRKPKPLICCTLKQLRCKRLRRNNLQTVIQLGSWLRNVTRRWRVIIATVPKKKSKRSKIIEIEPAATSSNVFFFFICRCIGSEQQKNVVGFCLQESRECSSFMCRTIESIETTSCTNNRRCL